MWGRPNRHTVMIVCGDSPPPGLQPDFLRHPSIDTVVTRSNDPEQALGRARRSRPKVIIHDLCDAEGTGLDACRRIRLDPGIATVPSILVAADDPGEQVKASAVVRTPIVLREYFDVIRRFVPLPRRRDLRHAINLRFEYVLDGHRAQAFTRDLSLYGAFLKTDRTLQPGTVIRVEFRLPGDWSMIDCAAVVRRCAPYDPGSRSMAGIAVEFVGMLDADLRRLSDFIGRHLA